MSGANDYTELPSNLPEPTDDGACDHLTGIHLLPVELRDTSGGFTDLSDVSGLTLVYCYPMTGSPDRDLPEGWDEIPGARGCTPQSCNFRDHHAELHELGARVFGLSTQDTEYQREAKERLGLPFDLLSDENLEFANVLSLPTLEVEGMTLIKRLTLIINDGRIEKVFYPVFPPNRSAEEVIEWLNRKQPERVSS